VTRAASLARVVRPPPRDFTIIRLLVIILQLGLVFALVAGWVPFDQYTVGIALGLCALGLLIDR